MSTNARANMIYLHEVIYTVPGREEPYMASVTSLHYDPVRLGEAKKSGIDSQHYRAFSQFRAAETSGNFPSVINIWEMDWRTLKMALATQFQDKARDTGMEEWWQRNLHLRRGGYDRVLIPAAYSPTGAELAKRKARREVFLHEVMWLPFGEPARYLSQLKQKLLPTATKLGVELIGAYRVASRPRQVLTVFAAPDWAKLSRFIAAAADGSALREWRDYRNQQVTRSEDLIGLPARHNANAVCRFADTTAHA
jgi:hypothetical protein